MWIKFKRGHPAFAYFVGDIVELDDTMISEYNLNEDGYTIPATKAEVAAAKAKLDSETLVPVDPQLTGDSNPKP